MRAFYLIILVAFALFLANQSHAEDVYNFYFQKVQGPDTAIQGGDEPTIESGPKVSGVAEASKTTATMSLLSKAKTKLKGWTVSAGRGVLNSSRRNFFGVSGDEYYQAYKKYRNFADTREGIYLGGQYRFSKYFGVDGNLLLADDFDYEIAGGLVLAPIRINTFGHDLVEFQVLLGGFYANVFDFGDGKKHKALDAYAGMGIAVNFTDKLAVRTASLLSIDAGDYGSEKAAQVTLGLTYRL